MLIPLRLGLTPYRSAMQDYLGGGGRPGGGGGAGGGSGVGGVRGSGGGRGGGARHSR